MTPSFSFLLLLVASDPFAGVWQHMDQADFDQAERAAMAIAAAANQSEPVQKKALELAFTAACQLGGTPCLLAAQRLVDWNPAWRPDSRTQPQMITAAREARLAQPQRLGNLQPVPWGRDGRWCSPAGTVQILRGRRQAAVLRLERLPGPCIQSLPGEEGFLIALDAQFRPLAALGSPTTTVSLEPVANPRSRALSIAGMTALVLGTGITAYFFLRPPPTGQLDVTLMVVP